MARFRELLLDVWREACQHIEITRSSTGIAELLAPLLPLHCFAVYRVNLEHRLLARVAVAPARQAIPPAEPAHVSDAELKKLAAWIRRGALGGPNERGQLPASLGPLGVGAWHDDVRVASLVHGAETLGVVAWYARPGKKFDERHELLLQALQEPLAVALGNDQRLHELAALREAAEADRRSLLRRLGRTDITDTVVGEHTGLAPVMRRASLVSASDAPVLLLGETGTGKEVIARAIHQRSDRRDGPFIRVNCGAIPPELVDSQLFGHEKGAFTGAAEQRKGWFERADGGTLFLDEIGELPLEAQVRFLRVLQEGSFERVGGAEAVRIDVRVIAATHRDLATMVQEGRFREDLWYRIAVFPILLPPLRERSGDIPELAAHFAQRAAQRFGLPPVSPSPEDFELLRNYHWPGNIRELGAVIDRAAILGEGRTLEIAAALGFSAPRRPTPATCSPGGPPRDAESVQPTSLDEAVRRHILATLRAARGKIEGPSGAAEMLAINPHTLRARMRKLGIDWSVFRGNSA